MTNQMFLQKGRFHIPFLFELRNGHTMEIRHIRQDEKDQAGFFEILKNLTKKEFYFRFFQQRNLADEYTRQEMIRNFVLNVDGDQHVCLVAEEMETDTLLASARYIRVPNKNFADVSITVGERIRRNGIARLMIALLAFHAHEKSVEKFIFMIHSENEPMIQLLLRNFYTAISDSYSEDEEINFVLETKKIALANLENRHG